ncbi:MAG TPA: hypothetical protein VMH87_13070 [Pseudomonadales bacterium]|nr:hypothetical protein [Pseudomonadales bacterium]
MKITERQFQMYLETIPPVIWTWIYGELKEGKAKAAFHNFLFDEAEHLRDLDRPFMRSEFDELISKFSEVETTTKRAATDYYIRHSWHRWLPWNWGK